MSNASISDSSESQPAALEAWKVHHLWSAIIHLLQQKQQDNKEIPFHVKNGLVYISSSAIDTYLTENRFEEDNLLSEKKKPNQTTESSYSQLYQDAIRNGLLIQSYIDNNKDELNTNGFKQSGPSTTSIDYFGLPLQKNSDIQQQQQSSHDYYCFECHLPSISLDRLLHCHHCWRSFHSDCASVALKEWVNISPEDEGITNESSLTNGHVHDFVCPFCNISRQYQHLKIGSKHFSKEEFNEILGYTYNRFKTRSKSITRQLKLLELPQTPVKSVVNSLYTSVYKLLEDGTEYTDEDLPIGLNLSINELTSYLALQYLVHQPLSLNHIEMKLANCQYQLVSEFLFDCLTISHVMECAVIAGLNQQVQRRRIRDTLSRMLHDARYELKEMLGCVDCYHNSNKNDGDKLWFCRPCSPPHLLVFARQRGFPFWPAKVIYPRYVTEISQCGERGFDVRFFGANHERCKVDQANLKDINSSLAELGIIKPNSSLEKALTELRNYRDLLEKGKLSTPPMKQKQNNRGSRINSIDSQGTFSTTDGEDEETVEKDRERSTKKFKSNHKEDSTNGKRFKLANEGSQDVDNDDESQEYEDAREFIDDSNHSQETDVEDYSNEEESKSSHNDNPLNKRAKSPTKRTMNLNRSLDKSRKRIPKKKIIYSPQSNKQQQQQQLQEAAKVSAEQRRTKKENDLMETSIVKGRRGRRPKGFNESRGSIKSVKTEPSPNVSNRTLNNEQQTISNRSRRDRRLSLNTISYVVSMPNSSGRTKAAVVNNISSSKAITNVSPNNSKVPNKKYYNKKLNLEKEKQEILSRRRLQGKEDKTKYEPPVTATKSTPTTNVQNRNVLRPILNSQPISAYVPLNGSTTTASFNTAHHKTDVQANDENQSQAETVDDETKQQGPQCNNEGATNENNDDDDDDEDIYMFDDKELEEHIDSYLEYQKEKEISARQYQMQQYYYQIQQQFSSGGGYVVPVVQQKHNLNFPQPTLPNGLVAHSSQQQVATMNHLEAKVKQQSYINNNNNSSSSSSSSHNNNNSNNSNNNKNNNNNNKNNNNNNNNNSILSPVPRLNGDLNFGLLPNTPVKSYIDYSPSNVYVPTKKNQMLVNSYLHHVENKSLSSTRTDYLAQLFINKNDLVDLTETPEIKKRGRPSKHDDSALDGTSKAKSILEKNYLQESSCNRLCLTKNIKTFKKFREFVEHQCRTEKDKITNELDEVKKELSTFKTKCQHLENELQKEKEFSKHCNPQIIVKLEEKYRREISEIKRKQWCVLCEAEAHFFCCNTSYCSPECQTKHWFSGHKYKCKRKEVCHNGANNNKKSVDDVNV